jgi:hypothetical protein
MPHRTSYRSKISASCSVCGRSSKTDGGAIVYGYGEEGPPKTVPWEEDKVEVHIGEVPNQRAGRISVAAGL